MTDPWFALSLVAAFLVVIAILSIGWAVQEWLAWRRGVTPPPPAAAKFPPDGLRFGSWRDQELTAREGGRPFVWFWGGVAAVLIAAVVFALA